MLTVTSVVTICHHTKECMILDLKEARMAAEAERLGKRDCYLLSSYWVLKT